MVVGFLLGTLALTPTLLAAGAAPGATPVGSEFQVNTYATGRQRQPSVATGLDGDFVVTWASAGSFETDTSEYSIQGQRFAAHGTPLSSQFQVNSYTTNSQRDPSVAVNADGSFVVVWQSLGSSDTDTSGYSIQSQRYDSGGAAIGSEFQVNTYTTHLQLGPSVAADADGNFVVVWTSWGSTGTDTLGSSIQGQRYASNGTPLGGEFQINSYTKYSQRYPSVAVNADGDFVVAWHSDYGSGSDSSTRSIQAQRYDAKGRPIGAQFQVNSYAPGEQDEEFPSVAIDEDGDFVIAWKSSVSAGSDTESDSVQGQRYDSGGSALGAQFQVNSYITGNQGFPSIAMHADGDFVVVWYSYERSNRSAYSIQGQRYDASGNPLGREFQVSTYPVSFQTSPSVAVDRDGDFVVVWHSRGSSGSDTSDTSIQGQRFTLEPAALPVDLDIKPGSDVNAINPLGRGVIPVAILSSDTFGAENVDGTTLAFGPAGAAPAHDLSDSDAFVGHLEDVNEDGLTDFISHYRTQETGIAFGQREACLTGETLDGTPFRGCDVIRTVGSCGLGFELILLLPPLLWLRRRRV